MNSKDLTKNREKNQTPLPGSPTRGENTHHYTTTILIYATLSLNIFSVLEAYFLFYKYKIPEMRNDTWNNEHMAGGLICSISMFYINHQYNTLRHITVTVCQRINGLAYMSAPQRKRQNPSGAPQRSSSPLSLSRHP
jgi:hypothetical protein